MDLILKRTAHRPDGIFGELLRPDDSLFAYTLEHAYWNKEKQVYLPKVPQGTFMCQRGEHRLERMVKPFTTFEIQNVPDHTNILFHWGNYNHDSDGCVLVGASIGTLGDGSRAISSSKLTFGKFMDLQDGVLLFHLLVMG